jgi:DNA-binding HxlR family transcriptional regulator
MNEITKNRGFYRIAANALDSDERRKILSVMLENQDKAMSFSELLKLLDSWDVEKLSKHLKILCEVGLVCRITDLAPQDDPHETSTFRAQYKTSSILEMSIIEFLKGT